MFTKPSVRISDLAGLQYFGMPGISSSCYRAIERLVQAGEKIEEAVLISCRQRHAFLLRIETEEYVVIQCGFASGYMGEGPRTLAEALQLLNAVSAPIEEVDVQDELFIRLHAAALTTADWATLRALDPVRPSRVSDYIYEAKQTKLVYTKTNDLLKSMPLAMPWSVVDDRLDDLAASFFDRPADSLLNGYRRLEETIRDRTALEDHGTKLLAKAFSGPDSALMWVGLDQGEQPGRAQLFTSAFMAFRNPLAHREKVRQLNNLFLQFLQLNHLFAIEREAVPRPVVTQPSDT